MIYRCTVSLSSRFIAPLLVIALAAACAPSPNVDVTPVRGLEQRVTITVSRGLQPEIRWSPDSGLGWLHVGRNDTREQVWELKLTDSTNSIRQPVRYGVAPSGIAAKPAIPLVPGAEYELSVGRVEMYRGSPMITQIARVRFRVEESK